MQRNLESIRKEVFELDEASQVELMEDIRENLAKSEHLTAWMNVANERLEEHRRGEGSTITAEEMLARGRQIIEAVERKAA